VSLKILLADDSMTAQNMGKKILADGGYDVVTVSNGAAAVKKLAEFTPDLVIADVYMPGYNGLEICEKIKKAAATASVPVLLSVGKLEPFRPEEGQKVHADGIIIKPFEASDLLAVTAKLAERVGKAKPAAAPESPVAETAIAVEEAPADEPVAKIEDASAPAQDNSHVPAFGLDDVAEATAPSFDINAQQPEYVREFGLDPHDAPTTMFQVPRPSIESAPEPSFSAHVPEADAAEERTVVPATVNLAINEVSLPEPEVADDGAFEPSVATAEPHNSRAMAESTEDEFEAKLAAAMAAYEAPVAEPTDAVAEVEAEPAPESQAFEIAPTSGIMPASPAWGAPTADEWIAPTADAPVTPTANAWVAEEATVTEAEQHVSLEHEMRAFAAAAGTEAVVAYTHAPAGPMGDTSIDDEVAAIVEESKEQFFPSGSADAATLTNQVDATDEAGLLASEPVEEISVEHDFELPANEESVPEFVSEASPEPVVASPDDFAAIAEPASEDGLQTFSHDEHDADLVAPLPELITHDAPSDWSSASSFDVAPASEELTTAATEIAAPAHDHHAVLTDDDFVTPEAPFAHAAVDEVAADPTVHAPVVAAVDHAREELVEEIHAVAPALHESDIVNAVERVMERMKGSLVAEIAKELAAKLGK
jgi:CheY-like chemotaxis protein